MEKSKSIISSRYNVVYDLTDIFHLLGLRNLRRKTHFQVQFNSEMIDSTVDHFARILDSHLHLKID